MRREGRARGMVQTVRILSEPLNSRVVNKVDVPPTAGLFVKVSPKPTNHSKFTGKSYRHPKSKDKSKGSYKLRSIDDKLSYKVIGWTVMADDRSDKTPAVGYSASTILNDLHQDHSRYYDYDNDYDYGYGYDDNNDDDDDNCELDVSSCVLNLNIDDEKGSVEMEVCREVVVMDHDDDIIIHGGVMADGDDGYQGFYDISGVFCTMVVDQDDDEDDGDESWSLVGGM